VCHCLPGQCAAISSVAGRAMCSFRVHVVRPASAPLSSEREGWWMASQKDGEQPFRSIGCGSGTLPFVDGGGEMVTRCRSGPQDVATRRLSRQRETKRQGLRFVQRRLRVGRAPRMPRVRPPTGRRRLHGCRTKSRVRNTGRGWAYQAPCKTLRTKSTTLIPLRDLLPPAGEGTDA
jgi:hypothetical protein